MDSTKAGLIITLTIAMISLNIFDGLAPSSHSQTNVKTERVTSYIPLTVQVIFLLTYVTDYRILSG